MNTRPFRRTCAAALLCLGTALPACAAPLLTAELPQSVATHTAIAVGLPDPAARLTLAIALPMRNQAALKALLRDLYDPASPRYRQYLSVAAFADRFGPTTADYEAAVAYFRRAGLHIIAISANRYMIDADGSVADIERIFNVTLRQYRHKGESRVFTAPDREPDLGLAVPILHVVGLDDEILPAPRLREGVVSRRGTGSGPHGNYIGSDIRAAYYGGTELTGKGQSLGLMELQGWNPADITLYFNTVKQTLNFPVIGISTDGTPITCTQCGDGEQALDIEYAASMAPGLRQMQVYVAKSPESVLNRMASDNTSKQLSTSWGWRNEFATDDPLFQEMAAQGQSFLVASGDDSSLKASEPWPEEDANITAVGGTDLVTTGPGGDWLAETGWADSAGGHAPDKVITIEPYQRPFINNANMGSRKQRNVPDIAGDANFDNYECYLSRCAGGWGGTSFAAPIWAGLIALVNEQAALKGQNPVGFLNPTFYTLSLTDAYRQMFHDITSGRSGKFTAVKKYDLVTGLGSPRGRSIADVLTGSSP